MIIQQMSILFSNRIHFNDLPLFRGGVIRMLGRQGGDVNTLFHNHLEEGVRWSYPLIQYKQIDGRAAIVCIGEGLEAIKDFFCTSVRTWDLHGREERMEIHDVTMNDITLDSLPMPLPYRIQNWIPLNSSNYERYREIDSLTERIGFLESILSANILSMAKGIGKRIDHRITCCITDLSTPVLIERKSVKMMSFDAAFKSNTLLPQYIGLGKHVSLGHGMITI